MTEKSINKSKPKYSALQNAMYLLSNMLKWDKKLFWLCFIQIPAAVIIPLLGIYIPKALIDSVSNHVSVLKLFINVGAPVLGIIVLNVILSSSTAVANFRAISYRMRYLKLMAEKTMDTDFENIDGPEGLRKYDKANQAVYSNAAATEEITRVMIKLCSNILGLLLYASIISTIHLGILLFLILSSVINYFVGKFVSNFEHKNKDNLAPLERKLKYLWNKTGEFKAAKDMRIYNMFPWFKDMFKAFKAERIYFQKKNIYHEYFAQFIDGILIFIRDGLTYGILIYMVIYRGLSISNFVLYFGAVAGFSAWLSGIVVSINKLNSLSLDMCDLREYLEMEDIMNRGNGVELPTSYEIPCDIELKNVYFKYKGAEDYTIKNMNIHINKGEKLALVGVNGAGKTTLVKLICGLYTPTKGDIYINGKKSSLYNRDEYYTLFSVVFQDLHLLPVSIEENISMHIEGKTDSKRIQKVLDMSGFIEKIKGLPNGKDTMLVKSVNSDAIELSGGEMQKLMLARALYKEAPIIILDEPTAALDPIAENEIYEKYNAFTKDHTSIFISHRLSSTRFCDRIVFMEGGTIVEQGDHNSLMSIDGKYKKMYDMQSYYYKNNVGGEQYA